MYVYMYSYSFKKHISKMYVLIERHNVHLRGPSIERNLLSLKEADLGPDIRESFSEKLVAGVSSLTCVNLAHKGEDHFNSF